MTLLKPLKSLKKLLDRLNELVQGINARTLIVPLGGGLDIQESTNGTLIALSSSGALASALTAGGTGTTGGTTGGSSTDLSALTARVAALEAILSTSGWTSVDVMDASCVRSAINVLTKP